MRTPNVVLVPMFDDCPKEREYWEAYRGFKVLAFSSTLAGLLESCGLQVLRVCYRVPVPSGRASFKEGLRGFFWPRTTGLDWRHVGPVAQSAPWAGFHLHTAHCPAEAVLPPGDAFAGTVVERTDWFEHPDDYGAVLARANVFFSPRRYEGIGMAFLEALALGQCVVAPDCPTANEYITSGADGYLFDPDRPGKLDWAKAEELGSAARERAEQGRREWEESLPSLRAFLAAAPLAPRRRSQAWLLFRRRSQAWLRQLFRWAKSILRFTRKPL